MAVKVVYDATRGLVQENDTTGAGGFVIKDTIISEGVEGTAADPVAAAADPGPALSISSGISLVKTTLDAAAGVVSVPDADASNIGQIKTVVYKTENAPGDSLTVKGTGLGAGIQLADVGDVLMLMWTGTAWNIVGQTA
jgi:hypothetical protein